jgi:tetratricopeptide (TPR) repeat protein
LEFEEILGYHLEQAYRYLVELGPLDDRGHGIGKDGAKRLSSAARRSFIRGDIHAARSLFRRANALMKKDDPERLAMLPELSETLMQMGEFVDARLLLDEALTGALQMGDDRLAANARLTQMFVRLYSGEAGDWGTEAIKTAEAVIPILERHNASGELATAWRLVSFVHGVGGRYSQAVEAAKHVVTHAREAGNVRLVARSGMGFAIGALLGPTPVPEVIRECERIIAGGLIDRQVESVILCVLAQLRAMRGEFDNARDLYRRGRSMLHELGQGVSAAATGIDLARVELLAGGDLAVAEKDVREDYEFLLIKGENYLLPSMAAALARIVREGGRDAEALALTVTAEQTAGADDVDAQVQWRSIRAPILARAGDFAGAESMANAALELAHSSEAPILLAETLCELAEVLALAGRPQEAEGRLTEALRLYSLKGDIVSTARIKARLGQ